jgi:KDEL-tailed cysteine endopeptidase
MEGAHFIKTGELLKLSEQQWIDCDRDRQRGCYGGLEPWAFDYAMHHAIELGTDYPYTAQYYDTCYEDPSKGQVNALDHH